MPSRTFPPPRARRTQADRSAATRDALVTAARGLFAEQGFAEVPTDSIVAAAGVTRGALYHQFADKTALFDAVMEAVEDDIARRFSGWCKLCWNTRSRSGLSGSNRRGR